MNVKNTGTKAAEKVATQWLQIWFNQSDFRGGDAVLRNSFMFQFFLHVRSSLSFHHETLQILFKQYEHIDV